MGQATVLTIVAGIVSISVLLTLLVRLLWWDMVQSVAEVAVVLSYFLFVTTAIAAVVGVMT